MQKTITIELKVRYADPQRFDIVRKAAVNGARGLLAAANLIADEHKPMLALIIHDPYDGKERINIFDDAFATDDEE